MKGLVYLAVEMGFTQKEILTEFDSTFLELIGDYLWEKSQNAKRRD